jgi:hypothetical protein
VSCILQFHDLNITPSAAGHGWGQAGHKVYTPTLTGLGERAHLMMNRTINLDTHVQDIVSVIRCEELSDVVLCGQSYGGMVREDPFASLPREAPRLCRGGSRSLTFRAVVHR